MAYSEVPNKVEVYNREGVKYFFVVNYYDDTPNLVNWYFVSDHGIDNEGADSIQYINEEIERYGWKLYKTLYNQWFEFEERSNMKYCRVCKSDVEEKDYDYAFEVCNECYIDKTRIH